MKSLVFQKIRSYWISGPNPYVLEISTAKNTRLPSKEKETNFIRNGAVLLEKQISSFEGRGGEPIKIFSEEDIYQATRGFDPDMIIGHVFATIYRGNIDDRIVAIKTCKGHHPTDALINFFLNQVTIKQQISHKNVVKLYGCCLETPIPMLVHELMHSSLHEHVHTLKGIGFRQISWNNRLRIATEVGYALSYMHCAGPKPIVHRDVKSSNVFLDECLSAKLSNFGFSISISPGLKEPMWPPVGSEGYIDPEYVQTGLVTEKCDVYSFGVLMMELLIGKDPGLFKILSEQDNDLVEYFASNMLRNSLIKIVDMRLLQEGPIIGIHQFAALAMRCASMPGETRPTMEEIVVGLREMQSASDALQDC